MSPKQRLLANIASQAKQVFGVDELQAVADRGYYSGTEILACHEAGIAVTLPKPVSLWHRGQGALRQTGLLLCG
jgi:hypothetical protein